MDKQEPVRLTFEQFMPPRSSFQLFEQKLTGAIQLHWHEFYEMNFFVDGRGQHRLNGKPTPLRRGSLILLTPADFHELWPDPGETLTLYNVIFSEEMLDDDLRHMLFQQSGGQSYAFGDKDTAMLEAEFQRIGAEVRDARIGHLRMIRGALDRIWIEVARTARSMGQDREMKKELASSLQPSVRNALLYVQHHFREDLTLAMAAEQARLAPNYFSECFRKAVGIPFQQYLQEKRLQFAKSLLHVSDLSVTDICYASGFNSLSHFERAFKRKNGSTPRQYRKALRLSLPSE